MFKQFKYKVGISETMKGFSWRPKAKRGVSDISGNAPGFRGSQISLAENESVEKHSLHQAARVGNLEEVCRLLGSKKLRNSIDTLDEHSVAPLHYAARFDHSEIVRVLVDKGADPLVRDKSKATALHYAARKKENANTQAVIDVITFLGTVRGGDVNAGDRYKSTPLHFAAMRGNVVVTETLLRNDDVEIDSRDEIGATPLHEAVNYDHYDVVALLIAHGASVTATRKDNITPLHLAATQGTLDMVALLVGRLPEEEIVQFINHTDKEHNTALHLAIESRNVPVVEYLIQKGADIQAVCRTNTHCSTPLHLAAVVGEIKTVEVLLASNADISALDIQDATPLHKAVEYGSTEVAACLLEQKDVNVDALDREVYTPLLTCCCYDNPKIVKLLLKKKANPLRVEEQERTAAILCAIHNQPHNLKVLLKQVSDDDTNALIDRPDRFGNTPLHFACKFGHQEVVQILLDGNANYYAKNEDEETPFHLASQYGMTHVCELLLEKTKDKVLNDEDEDSNTALHLACENGHLEVVRLLIQKGADKENRNCDEWTPLDFAASFGHYDVCEYLLDEDVPVNPHDRNQTTPLHLASSNGHVDVVKLLLERGADVSERNKKGQNALDMAISRGHAEVASAIIQSNVWKRALLNETHPRNSQTKVTPLRSMIKKMPDVALQVLDRCIDTGPEGANPETDKGFYIQYNFELLDDTFSVWDKSGIENEYFQETLYAAGDDEPVVKADKKVYTNASTTLKNNHPAMMISRHKEETLMSHPLTRALMRRKWRIASFFYLSFLIFYTLFLSMLTSYMLIATAPFDVNFTACNLPGAPSSRTQYQDVARIIVLVLSALGLIAEFFQLCVTKSKYIEFNNLLDWFCYLSAILVVVDITNCGARNEWQWQLGAITLLACWMDMLLFLRKLPWLGIYVIMVVEILKTFLKFFPIFFLFILAFAISFFVLLQNQVPFATPWYSIIKTWVMMIGEMDYADIFHSDENVFYEATTYAVYVIFLIIIALIVMNLLTGLAVDDVNILQKDSNLKKLTMQLELALDVEVAMPYVIQRLAKCVVKFERVYPNRPAPIFGKYFRKLMEGPLNKELIADEVLGRALEDDREEELKQLEFKLMSKIDKNRAEVRGLHTKIDNIENMITQLMNHARKRAQRRASKLSLSDVPEVSEDV